MPHAYDSIAERIATRAFSTLVGERESEHLDAKAQPYQLTTSQAKRELAKDITGFANASGGFIIIGFNTAQDPLHPTEQVIEINLFPKDLLNPDQYYKLIKEWVYPPPAGVTVLLYEHGPHPGHVLGIITIPPQEQTAKPFLITKTVDETKTTDITIGYAERRRDTTPAMTVVELHHALRLGLNMEREILGRLQAIETRIGDHYAAQTITEDTKNAHIKRKTRTDRITGQEILQDGPRLIISCTPIGSTGLRTVLSSSPTSIRQALARPTSIRSGGWSLYTGDTPQFTNGEYLQVDSRGTMIHLYRDGALIVAVRIDRNNLAWSDKEDRDLHPLAMIELITNTTLFYSRVLDDLQPRPAQLLVGLDLELLHTEQRSVRLPAGGISGHYGFWGPRRDAPAPFWRTALTIDTATYDPARVAFLLVRELYAWFGQSEEDIPYTEGTEDDKRISTDAIQAMG